MNRGLPPPMPDLKRAPSLVLERGSQLEQPMHVLALTTSTNDGLIRRRPGTAEVATRRRSYERETRPTTCKDVRRTATPLLHRSWTTP